MQFFDVRTVFIVEFLQINCLVPKFRSLITSLFHIIFGIEVVIVVFILRIARVLELKVSTFSFPLVLYTDLEFGFYMNVILGSSNFCLLLLSVCMYIVDVRLK